MKINLRPYQQEAVNKVYEHLRTRDDNPCIVLPTGCHAKGHPILMYDGYVKKVEDIAVGDLLMGDDGTPRTVYQVLRGREQMIHIIPCYAPDTPRRERVEFTVNKSHLLSLYGCNWSNVEETEKKLPVHLCIKAGDKLHHPLMALRQHVLGTNRSIYRLFETRDAGTGDYYGFNIDGNHLYLDGYGYEHHNCGKSLVLGKIASDAVSLWHGRVLILAHVKELLEQNADKVRKLCPDLKVGVYSAGLKSRDTSESVIVAGIQSVYDKADRLGAFDLVVVDEAHLISPEGDGMYRTFLKDMKLMNPLVRVIGLTATPFRLKGGAICRPENILNHVCYEAGLKEMIAQGYLSPLVSRAGHAEADLSTVHTKAGEFVQDELASAMDNEELVNASCEEIVRLTKDRKSVLIFCTSIEHCKHVAERIQYYSRQECAVVTGSTSSGERAEIIARFRGEKIPADLWGTPRPPLKFLANVGVLTTGFDAPNTDCVVLMRPTQSAGLLLQMCLDLKTEILTSDGWKKHDEVTLSDKVAGFNMQTSQIEYCDIEQKIFRPLEQNEKMLEIKAPHLDIRASNMHDLVYRSRNRKNWHKKTMEELQGMCDSFYIPVAGSSNNIGLPLADDEIRFIGWFLTDGFLREKDLGVSISQSVNSPYNEAIVRMLNNCGFAWNRYLIKRKGELARYADLWHYYVSYDNPRGKNKGKEGWKRLFPYLTQRISVALGDISERQLSVLLDSMNQANGSKRKNADYTPKTYKIAVGNHEALANELQALLVTHGYRCNIAVQQQKTSFHVNGYALRQYILHIKKQDHATVGGCHSPGNALIASRCTIKPSSFKPRELVWCVKNHLGTLVTRRNGKVAIIGNCGRGTRLSPATGKTNCLILDYGSNIMRHGPLDMIKVKEPGSGGHGGEAPVKKCPKCNALIAAGYGKCPECGYEFPPPERSNLTEHASNEGVLSGEVKDEEYDVHGVFYEPHVRRNADEGTPRTMRVDYEIGIGQYKSEWVCPEHTGYARKKFERWWKERAPDGCPIPNTVDEAVSWARAGALSVPMHITVRWVTGEKFDRISKVVLGERPEMTDELMWQLENGPLTEPPGGMPVVEDDDIPF
jgi:superfamily II DNA or RNA helicase